MLLNVNAIVQCITDNQAALEESFATFRDLLRENPKYLRELLDQAFEIAQTMSTLDNETKYLVFSALANIGRIAVLEKIVQWHSEDAN